MESVVLEVQQTLMQATGIDDDEKRGERLRQLLEDVCAEIEDDVRTRSVLRAHPAARLAPRRAVRVQPAICDARAHCSTVAPDDDDAGGLAAECWTRTCRTAATITKVCERTGHASRHGVLVVRPCSFLPRTRNITRGKQASHGSSQKGATRIGKRVLATKKERKQRRAARAGSWRGS